MNHGRTFSIEQEYDVLPKGFEGVSVSGQDFDDFVGEICNRSLVWPRVMG